ncbi:glycoside hydrolase [Pseudoclavibacter sp. CFCC 13796]|uniref:C40 family peptidase n=1 Tax=Pseudoclavibacter sp. CFCC 13796 TaxID=2615179 RepID=UPI001300D82F|nr:NlpC/P60 family protein [Pseudoclavibacter sp. CFCC 13796]KAB1660497.1 glycoside hydrolase [Pseudoclavibacter sp. CFCC 13796]
MLTRLKSSKVSGTLATLAVAGGLVFATAVPSQAAEVSLSQETGVTAPVRAEMQRQQLAVSTNSLAPAAFDDLEAVGTVSADTPEPVAAPPLTPPSTVVRTVGDSSAAKKAPTGSTPASAQAVAGGTVVQTATLYLNVPYAWGGTTPAGFDCSGFTSFVFAQHGVSLPRISQAQMNVGQAVGLDQAQPGDLVWMNGGGHVGIYLGGGKVIHASKPGDVVKISPISVWNDYGFRRI